ncbi:MULTISPECIES: hypothetical protein [Wolbachia]|nr:MULTISPECIES: hypothetical protein [Wolbachia]MDX5496666.1 hypothetical protein [Wolbachia endosymbiont of Nomada fabriciana]MDX5507624.1 hypothetical protein [Wolbachia endosymbiont of Hylaeus sinuatus]MDX5528203.1 hypothetical protein [Wolbachia endosymbiont of Andrena minutula]
MRYLLSEERCNKAIPVSSTGMTPSLANNVRTAMCVTLALESRKK